MHYYKYLLIIVVFPYLCLGNKAINAIPLKALGKGSLYELLAFSIIALGFLRGITRRAAESPIRPLFLVFVCFYVFIKLRSFMTLGDFSSISLKYLKELPFVFLLLILTEIPNPTAGLKKLKSLVLYATYIIVVFTIMIVATGTEFFGLNLDQYTRTGRIIWGNSTTLTLSAYIYIIAICRPLPFISSDRIKESAILICILAALLLTQSRALIFSVVAGLFIIPIFNGRLGANRFLIILALLITIPVFFFDKSSISEGAISRFERLENEIRFGVEDIASGRQLVDRGRLEPLLRSMDELEGFEILTGRGYATGYLETSLHLHSGLGYLYVSNGLIGIVGFFGVTFYILFHLLKFSLNCKIPCMERDLLRGLVVLMMIKFFSNIVVDNLAQGIFVDWAIPLAMAELARRSYERRFLVGVNKL